MDQLPKFWDDRQTANCAYCGGATGTRDHVPSRVLLDEPFPPNLPVVPACRECNEALSSDEEYLACVLDCTLAGSAGSGEIGREKIKWILARKPALAARLAQARSNTDGVTRFEVETHRVRNVVLKLARGYALFELNEPQYAEPSSLKLRPLPVLSAESQAAFERPPQLAFWPEVGSRAMQRLGSVLTPNWLVVQPGRYRYLAYVHDAVVVRVVLSEYLACEVEWAHA